MEVSDKLAIEFHTIILSHTVTLLVLVSFSTYIYFRAKRSALLYGYLSVVGMIALWMISKIFKTVSPVIGLRWFFIVTQYFAIDLLGVCLLVFAYIYLKNRLPSKRLFALWLVPAAISFVVVVTNPLHMTFYSYFDMYKDRFGSLFYVVQSVQYVYLIVGCVMLSRGFTKQPGFHGKRMFGRLFSVLVLLPLMANLYYILFKMNVFRWIFPFSVFDFSPIAASVSLILFMIPAMTFRFFDMSPVSLERLYEIVPQGVVFASKKWVFYEGNQAFCSMLQLKERSMTLEQLLVSAGGLGANEKVLFAAFVSDDSKRELEITLTDGRCVKVTKTPIKNGHLLFCFNDMTQANRTLQLLTEQNSELERVGQLLDAMADNARELAIARTKAQMAQNVHDILGHSLTVVTGTAELAAADNAQTARQKISQIEELLTGSLNDLRNALSGKGSRWGETTLIKALHNLKNENIFVDITIHGKVYELNGSQNEAVYRLCQEAVTNAILHGKATSIYLIVRYQPGELEVFAVDNGCGCKTIVKSYGLAGIEKRFAALNGSVRFGSDGESGFTIYAVLPRT